MFVLANAAAHRDQYLLQDLHGEYLSRSGSHHLPHLKNLQGGRSVLEVSSSSGASSCSWHLDYLSVSAFAEDPQQLEALWPDGLRPLVDIVLRYLDLLTVVHVAAPTLCYSRSPNQTHVCMEHASYLQLKAAALIHDVVELSLRGKKKITQISTLFSSLQPSEIPNFSLISPSEGLSMPAQLWALSNHTLC